MLAQVWSNFDMTRHLFLVLAATSLVPIGPVIDAAAASSIPLAAHRAIYDLSLDQASDRSGVTGVKGRIVYEFEGSSCEGYTTRHRIVMRTDTDEISRFQDQQLSSYETAEGDFFQFVSKSFLDGVEDKNTEGSAKLADDAIAVEIKGSDDMLRIPDAALFPTAHIKALLEKAEAGERFFELPIYDGSSGGSTAYTTTVVVGAARTDDILPGGEAKGMRSWPVSVSYFEEADEKGDGLPVYRIAFTLFEDGVTSDLVIDYGDFVLKGKMVEIARSEGEGACK
jgi:hypothetical protein